MNRANRLLVVDDDPNMLQVFSDILRHEGYETSGAATGEQGLELAREKCPDLVLLDVNLPGMSGFEVCRQIKADPGLSDTMVVLFSGAARSSTDKVHGLEVGADDYILKSTDWNEIRARIRTVIRLRDTTAALRASEQHYRRLVEILPDGVSIVDLEGRLLAVNSQAAAMLGYEDQAELMQKSAFDLTPPEEHERVKLQIAEALQKGSLRDAETVVLRKNGERFPIELSIALLRDAHDLPSALVCVWREVTRRKQAEEAMRATTERFRQIAENIREVFWITNSPKDEMIYVSPGYEEIWGRTCAELYASPHAWLDGIHPDDRERVTDAARTRQASGDYNEIYRIVRPDGSIRWIQDRAFPVRDESGQVYRVVGIAEDITDRKQAEESLRESEARKGAVMQAVLDGIITIDHTGKIVEVNFAAEKMFGYPGATLVGSELSATLLPPGLQDWFQSGLVNEFAVDDGPILGSRIEIIAMRLHQVEFPVEFSIARIEQIGLPMFTAFFRDISGRRRTETKLATLVHAVETTTEPVYITDLKDRVTFVNRAFLKTYGYAEAGIMGKPATLLHSPANPPALLPEILAKTRSGGWRGELLHRRKDGTDLHVLLSTSHIEDRTGAVTGFMRVAQDITERKRGETLLQAQRDFGILLGSTNDLSTALRGLLDLAVLSEGIDCGWVYSVDPGDGGLNLEAHQGLSAEFVRRASHLAGDSAQAAELKAAKLGDRINLEFWSQLGAEPGNENLTAISVFPIRHGNDVVALLNAGSHTHHEIPMRSRLAIGTIIAHVGDAIARIKAEQSLRTSRELLEKTVNGLYAAVFLIAADSVTILESNPAATRIFGYRRDELIGRSIADLHLDQPAFEEFKAHLHSAAKPDGLIGEFDFKMKRRDGTVFPTRQSLNPVRDTSGGVTIWVSIIRDVTERTLAEAELRQLPRRIIEAQEAERMRVARDLHDGVNQVIASVKMRLRKVGERLAETAPASREILARCENLLLQAIEENRRIARNLRPSDLDEFGLAVACRNFCSELRSRSDLIVKCQISRRNTRLPPAVELNLFRIVQEAVNNIEKYAGARTLRLRIVFQEDAVLLRIEDDGHGFDLKATRVGSRKRQGIGLTNMRQRAASIGGTFEMSSKLGQGTVISVNVPCKPIA